MDEDQSRAQKMQFVNWWGIPPEQLSYPTPETSRAQTLQIMNWLDFPAEQLPSSGPTSDRAQIIQWINWFGIPPEQLPLGPQAPRITSPLVHSSQVGQAFLYRITATQSPTSFGATPLPPGLSVDTTTGEITGTPGVVANTDVEISATNDEGTGTATLQVRITAAPPSPTPVITSAGTHSGWSGVTITPYQITANIPVTSYNATGPGGGPLPTGLEINTTNGQITGSTTQTGAHALTVSATTAAGQTGSRGLTLTITGAPQITNPQPITHTGTVGIPIVNFPIQANNSPQSRTATGLPPGLSVPNPTTAGVISGTPTPGTATPGLHDVTLRATNPAGEGTAQLALTLNPQPVPVVTSASFTRTQGTAWTHTIAATNPPFLSRNATGGPPPGGDPLPAGITVNPDTGVISGDTTVALGTHTITMTATNHGGPSAPASLTVTIEEAVVPVGWQITNTYTGPPVIDGNTATTGRFPATSWTGWDPAFAADLTDEVLYTGPNAPRSQAELKVRMFAQWLPDASPATRPQEVEVPFDMWPGTIAPNFLHEWGVDNMHQGPELAITIRGANSTGQRIELRLVKEV